MLMITMSLTNDHQNHPEPKEISSWMTERHHDRPNACYGCDYYSRSYRANANVILTVNVAYYYSHHQMMMIHDVNDHHHHHHYHLILPCVMPCSGLSL